MRWRPLAAAAAAISITLLSSAAPAYADPAPKVDKGITALSFTFDDGWKGQELAAESLFRRNMHGTFYLNSGQIGYPAYMSLDQVRQIAQTGNEIGGHTVSHADLTKLSPTKARAEVCDDRATLSSLGFTASSFAYPNDKQNPSVQRIVQECGYTNTRPTDGVWGTNETKVSVLKAEIVKTEKAGGGWVPMVFQYVCDCPEKGKWAITPKEFDELVAWVALRPSTTKVYTVDELVGGAYKPVTTGQVIERFQPKLTVPVPASQGVPPNPVAFHIGSIGISQGFVVAVGLGLTLFGVVLHRVRTRGDRYAKAQGK